MLDALFDRFLNCIEPTQPMTGAELRACREATGVSPEDFGDLLGDRRSPPERSAWALVMEAGHERISGSCGRTARTVGVPAAAQRATSRVG